jgi:hypothetical protein
MESGLFIPDPDFLPIPDPWVKRAPDPGSGSAILAADLHHVDGGSDQAFPHHCCQYFFLIRIQETNQYVTIQAGSGSYLDIFVAIGRKCCQIRTVGGYYSSNFINSLSLFLKFI